MTETSLASVEGSVVRLDGETVDIKITHYFSDGVYAREMFVPKGVAWVGKIHKRTNLSIMSQGDMSFRDERGLRRVKAPYTFVAPPGTQRIGYAHEDTVWTVIHGTHETDVEKIELEFIAQSEQDWLDYQKAEQLEKKS